MAQTFNVPPTPLVTGETWFGPFNVSAHVETITLRFQRAGLPVTGAELAYFTIWVSEDGGTNYYKQGEVSLQGGSEIGRDGTSDWWSRWAPFPSPCLCKVHVDARIDFTLTGMSIIVN